MKLLFFMFHRKSENALKEKIKELKMFKVNFLFIYCNNNIQQCFIHGLLKKRNEKEKFQDQKEREGLTTKNADIAYRIREGTKELKDLL